MDAKEGLKSLHRLTPYLNSPSSRFATTDPLYSCESEALLGVSLGELSGVSRADSDGGEIKSPSTSLSSAPSSSFAGGGGSSSGRGGRRKKGAKRSARNKQVVYLGKMPARMAHKARGKGGEATVMGELAYVKGTQRVSFKNSHKSFSRIHLL